MRIGTGAVVTHHRDKDQPVPVVVVGIFPVGFEGQGRRFIAMTSRLP